MLRTCLWLVMWSGFPLQILTAGKSLGFPAVICTSVYKEKSYRKVLISKHLNCAYNLLDFLLSTLVCCVAKVGKNVIRI